MGMNAWKKPGGDSCLATNRRQWQPEIDPSWEQTLIDHANRVTGGARSMPVRQLTEKNLTDAFNRATGVANSENDMSRAMLQVVRHAASVYDEQNDSQMPMQLMPSDLYQRCSRPWPMFCRKGSTLQTPPNSTSVLKD